MEARLLIPPEEYEKAQRLQDQIDKLETVINVLSMPSKKDREGDRRFVHGTHEGNNTEEICFKTFHGNNFYERKNYSLNVDFEYLKPALLGYAKNELERLLAEQKKLGIYVK